ncbi:DUF4959 domain-containing protein [Fodinibius salsisoli]|uniref:DUF4959 domain-containing protein n=1 Tax=Fodinibius salsisoli TaxID=2820877 RepID=A0ABT3PQJ8_9BACT|nr:DUF4959 domain-containing protein [Fodinibius salsisoli]MCW9708121.1 DUF4959 domain-containing protein [Fodinibius salsisoli]
MNWLKIQQYLLLIGVCTALIISCKKSGVNDSIESDGTPPGKVQNVSVENVPGGAKLTYTLPDDEDLLYVRAEYTLSTGKEMEVKSSFYNNSMMIEGYADSLEHTVELYAVDKGELASEPTSVTIEPKRSTIWDTFKSLKTQAAFGGIQVEAANPERNDIAILILQKNDFGEWETNPNSIYTSTNEVAYTLRGLDTLRQEFAFTVRDRWLNYTDTLFTEIAPLYEAPIPQADYNANRIEGDAPRHNSTPMYGLWDGDIINWPNIYMTQAAHTPSEPHTFTFDIGQTAKLSRIRIWDYPEYYSSGGFGRTYYYLGCPRKFEIWGASDPSIEDPENWMQQDNWHKLGTFEETKPSGLSYGQQNNEDYQTANAGFSWEFDINAPKVRYLRFRSLENWGGSTNIGIAEVQVYGDSR